MNLSFGGGGKKLYRHKCLNFVCNQFVFVIVALFIFLLNIKFDDFGIYNETSPSKYCFEMSD